MLPPDIDVAVLGLMRTFCHSFLGWFPSQNYNTWECTHEVNLTSYTTGAIQFLYCPYRSLELFLFQLLCLIPVRYGICPSQFVECICIFLMWQLSGYSVEYVGIPGFMCYYSLLHHDNKRQQFSTLVNIFTFPLSPCAHWKTHATIIRLKCWIKLP